MCKYRFIVSSCKYYEDWSFCNSFYSLVCIGGALGVKRQKNNFNMNFWIKRNPSGRAKHGQSATLFLNLVASTLSGVQPR